MSAAPRVWVTGIGLLSPLGDGVERLAARVRAQQTAIEPLSDCPDAYGAWIENIPLDLLPLEARARLGRLDRLCRLLLAAAFSAVDSAKLSIDAESAHRVGLAIGTGLGCLLTNAEYNQKLVEHGPAAASPRLFAYTVSSAAAGELSIALGIKGPNLTSHQGIAAGLGAVGYAYDWIRGGKADVVLAGGVDALGPALVAGLRDMGLLKSKRAAQPYVDVETGIHPAEGAAVLVLENAAHAQRRGAACLAVIKGHASGFEPTLTRRDRRPSALTTTMRQALSRSEVTPADVDLVVGSAHATALDDLERSAIGEAIGSPTLLAPKQFWGECFAAHGVLATALAIGLRSQLALIHALCYGGPTVSLVVGRE